MDIPDYFVLMLIGFSQLLTASKCKSLDDYITQYDELHYDTDTLHHRHLRFRRSNTQQHLKFKFKAYNRDFELELVPDDSIFTSDFKLRHHNGSTYPADISFIYKGKVKGEPTSHVHGSVLEGVFRGFVITDDNTIYHIEHVRRFFPVGHQTPYHSVIYRSDHVNLDPYRHRRAAGEGTCGVDRLRQWMEKKSSPRTGSNYQKAGKYSKSVNNDNGDHLTTTDRARADTSGNLEEMPHKTLPSNGRRTGGRVRRNAAKSVDRLGARNTCYMYLRSDPVLWRYIKRQGVDDNAAKNEILAMFASHVSAINSIYTDTNFTLYPGNPTNYYYTGVQFRVQRTTVMTDQSEHCNNSMTNGFCNPDIDVSNFLDMTSRENHDQFCLVFTFTARDFSGGTLGLAWVASTENSAGGICEKNKPFPGEDGRTVSKSLNTGIVTIINYGKRVVPTVSHLTFAHEVGHNFGSPHDTGICAPYNTQYPGASNGNFIMYASATHGNLPNNDKFSQCSKDNMTRVLHSLLEGTFKKNCLHNQEGSFCGNGIVEEGEECDCGYEDDCDEICCNPRHEPSKSTDCTLRKTVNGINHILVCSPSQGPCCTPACQFISLGKNKTCRASSDCVDASQCPGDSAKCPPARKRPDIVTLCNDKLAICQNGECTGSLCKRIGYTTNNNISLWKECMSSTSCYLSCQFNGSCISSRAIPDGAQYDNYKALVREVTDTADSEVPLPAGSPCDDFKGYCDVFSRCRSVNNNGPLARLQNLIFGNETWTMIREWIVEHWWIVMLIAMGLVLFMIMFIKLCGVNTPSFDPKHKPATKVTPSAPPKDLNHKQVRVPRAQYLDDYEPKQQRRPRERELYRLEKRQRY
ncbi:disintegrin and metalloproteinase domain-containing protein 10-like [Ylistrum balloti]|uniref:disintegrin and metalloproteinase domain-containing protein 10-like n=1 Tax=Ylistrum balloti TaxID=509963 RepID=UPI002905BFEF|nr:disintegrin and metalloproteinase domain-containing protein 10-like [Ylistrum balloti]